MRYSPLKNALLITLMAITVVIMVIGFFVTRGTETRVLINRACAQHNGVSRIDSPFVVCRDGYVASY